MKIAIITIHGIPNYGSALQAFALQRYLNDTYPDSESIIVDYEYQNRDQTKKLIKKIGLFPYIQNQIRKYKHSREKNTKFRLERFKKFRDDQMVLTKHYNSYRQLVTDKSLHGYDLYITGSDQIWNSKTVMGDSAFLWSFIPDNKIRISFSASFGIDRIYDEYIELFKKYLSKYRAIGVREQSGLQILGDMQLNKEIVVTCDPTFLLTKNIYQELLNKKQIEVEGDYILVYALTYAFDPKPAITEVIEMAAEKYGCKVIFMSVSTVGYKGTKEIITNGGPYDFLYLIANAKYVVTSSFHGTAFATIFRKPFTAVCPENGDNRIKDFLYEVKLSNSIVYSNQQNASLSDDKMFTEEFEFSYNEYVQNSKNFLSSFVQ